MNILIFLLILFGSTKAISQNLVMNSGFEITDSLNRYTKTPRANQNFYCRYWFVPNNCSPDLYIVDSLDSSKTNIYPLNHGIILIKEKLAKPHTGSSYIAIVPFSPQGYTEHIGGELENKLEHGKKYSVSFYIMNAGRMSTYYFARFGILFSKEKIIFKSMMPFYEQGLTSSMKAAVENNKDNFITNDSTWQKLEFTYTAAGGEKYFLLGFFHQDDKALVDLINQYSKYRLDKKKQRKAIMRFKDYFRENLNHSLESEDNAYYFIDDVSVEEIK